MGHRRKTNMILGLKHKDKRLYIYGLWAKSEYEMRFWRVYGGRSTHCMTTVVRTVRRLKYTLYDDR